MKHARVFAILVLLTMAVSAAPSQAQRVNPHSNTPRGGADVKQVAGATAQPGSITGAK